MDLEYVRYPQCMRACDGNEIHQLYEEMPAGHLVNLEMGLRNVEKRLGYYKGRYPWEQSSAVQIPSSDNQAEWQAGMENRVEKLENRVEKLENRVEKLENRMEKLENRMEKLENRMEKIENRVEKIEEQLAAIHSRHPCDSSIVSVT